MASRVSGFTIIELMLFLAISSLLMVGLMASIGTNLNNQRYSDAVQSFKNTLQDQFAATTSVQNNRSSGVLTCNTFGAIIDTPAGSSEGRGQSTCTIAGRYVIIRNSAVSSYPVTAYQTVTSGVVPPDDVDALRTRYALNLDTKNVARSTLEWGVRLAWPIEGPYMRPAGSSREIAILFVRSPETGQVYVFSSNNVPSEVTLASLSTTAAPSFIRNMIINEDTIAGRGSRTMCVDPVGLIGAGGRAGIRLESFAASPTAIKIVSNEQLDDEGAGTQC